MYELEIYGCISIGYVQTYARGTASSRCTSKCSYLMFTIDNLFFTTFAKTALPSQESAETLLSATGGVYERDWNLLLLQKRTSIRFCSK